jgi:RecA-family ATPase
VTDTLYQNRKKAQAVNRAAALQLARDGFVIFPAHAQTSRPYVSAWQNVATADPDQVEEWWNKWPNAVPALPTGQRNGVAVLDVDMKKGKNGLADLEVLGLDPDRLSGGSVTTPSGGRHYYFEHEEGLRSSAGQIAPGLDVRAEGGYVIAPGAWSRRGIYKAEGIYLSRAMVQLVGFPKWRDELRPPRRERTSSIGEKTSRPFRVIREALFAIPNDGSIPDNASRQWWLHIGMALHHETDGSAEGLETWHEWSSRWSGYDADDATQRWRSFHRQGGPVRTAYHILNVATDHGWRDPRIDEMFDDVGEEQRAEEEMQADIDELVGDPIKAGLFAPASSWAKDDPPRREWLIEGLIPNCTVTMLGGDGGTGKSLLALQLAVAAATGGRWIGREVARPGKVMFLSAEDDRHELHRRLSNICDSDGVGVRDLDRLLIRSLAGEDALLATLDRKTNTLKTTALHDSLDKAMVAGPSLVVLDTLADLHSGEENHRAHARQFIGMLRGLAIRHNCAVLLLAHPSLTGMANGSGLSGSTAWNASVRSRLYLDRAKDDGIELDPTLRILKTVKANYGATGGEITMHWREGVFIADVQNFDEERPAEKAERVFLKLLDTFTEQKRYVSPKPSVSYAPKVFIGHPDCEGCSKRALQAAMETLLRDCVIVVVEHGRPGKMTSRLERAK